MNEIGSQIQAIAASEWIYAIIFAVAVAESVIVTSYVISGTICFVVVGGLVGGGVLAPIPSFFAIYTGSLCGDLAGYIFAERFSRTAFVASALRRLEPLMVQFRRGPTLLIFAGQLTPYARALVPLLAANTMPLKTYLLIDLCAALVGTLFYMSLGYVGAGMFGNAGQETVIKFVGIGIVLSIVACWTQSRFSSSPSVAAKPDLLRLGRTIRFLIWFLPWQVIRKLENALRGTPSRRLRRCLADCFPDVRPGDIFVVRLHAPAPWGRWAHSAIATSPLHFAHGFGSHVSAHSIASLPVRYAIAHLRVRCSDEVAASAAAAATSSKGKPVSVLARRGDTERFSCASLVVHAYGQSGIELVPGSINRIVPDDLFTSSAVDLVRIVSTEKVKRQTQRYVFDARQTG